MIKNCRYCDRPLSQRNLDRSDYCCPGCHNKINAVKKFVKTCNEFKKIINYEAIKNQRAKRAENYGERKSM
jgi:hypothetical protein